MSTAPSNIPKIATKIQLVGRHMLPKGFTRRDVPGKAAVVDPTDHQADRVQERLLVDEMTQMTIKSDNSQNHVNIENDKDHNDRLQHHQGSDDSSAEESIPVSTATHNINRRKGETAEERKLRKAAVNYY